MPFANIEARDNAAERHGRVLIRAGVLLFAVALVNGFLIHGLAIPRLGLSAHLLGLMSGMFLMLAGLAWPRLLLGPRLSLVAAAAAVLAFYVGWACYFAAAALAIGGMFPLAGGGRSGELQEAAIMITFATAALAMFGVCGAMIYGLRPGRRS